MAASQRPRLTGLAGRRFGLTMAVMFGLVAALAWWRDAPRAVAVLGLLAVAFAVAALVAPAALRPVERGWTRFGDWLGRHVTTPVLFTLFWWVAFVPIGLLRRIFGRSPIARDPAAPTYWVPRPARSDEVARSGLERQF